MTYTSSSCTEFDVEHLRALVAKQLGIDVRRVTAEAHLTHDLGADWLDRLELILAIEDKFVGVEISDNAADQIEIVSDLIEYLAEVTAKDAVHLA